VTPIESAILGAIQGITEFLPVSSSAHLIVVPHFLRFDDGDINKLTYDVMLHFGTLCAVLLIYGKRFALAVREGLSSYLRGEVRDTLLTKIIWATLPAGILGLLFKDIIEIHLRTPRTTIITLTAVSILMIVVERLQRPRRGISYPIALVIGIAQALALVPGVSRSGITIVAGIFLGLKRDEAVDFSFMLSIPIILGTSLMEFRHVGGGQGNMTIYVAGALTAFVFGAMALRFLIGYLKRHTLDVFAWYRIGLALVIAFLAYH
jgi:undecaprenyl-diphosphatase